MMIGKGGIRISVVLLRRRCKREKSPEKLVNADKVVAQNVERIKCDDHSMSMMILPVVTLSKFRKAI